MKIIVGLGNLGKEYENTRHNVGFMFIDAMAKCHDLAPVDSVITFHTEKKFEAEIGEANKNGEKLIFVKPHTYMNASGKAVAKILDYYKAKEEDLIVIMDDVDLPLGTIRIRKEGSSGGHKGLQNIIDSVKSENFVRIRIGISSDSKKKSTVDTVQFVLGRFSKREEPLIQKSISLALNQILPFIGNNKEIPCHTFSITGKEQGVE